MTGDGEWERRGIVPNFFFGNKRFNPPNHVSVEGRTLSIKPLLGLNLEPLEAVGSARKCGFCGVVFKSVDENPTCPFCHR